MSETLKPKLNSEQHAANRDMVLSLLPLLVFSAYLYGWRPVILFGVALLCAYLSDRVAAVLHGVPADPSDNSSLAIGGVIAMMMPASVPYYILIISIICAVLLAKEAFGGVGNYPFNPMAVGYVIAAVCWPEQVMRYPQPFSQLSLFGAQTVALTGGNAYTLKNGGLPNIAFSNMVLGNYAGPMGATCLLIITSCAVFLWTRRRLQLAQPLSFMLTCAVIAYQFPRLGELGLSWPWVSVLTRVKVTGYELASGMLLFAAVFILSEPTTMPKHKSTQIVSGILLGFLTMMYHYFGTFEIGVCFALIVVNAVTDMLDRVVIRLIERRKVGKLHDRQ